jgi:hypothetical protein
VDTGVVDVAGDVGGDDGVGVAGAVDGSNVGVDSDVVVDDGVVDGGSEGLNHTIAIQQR